MACTSEGAGQVGNSFRIVAPRVVTVDLHGRGSAYALAERFVSEQSVTRGQQGVGIARRVQQTGLSISHYLGDLASRSGHDRDPTGHVLKHLERREIERMLESGVRRERHVKMTDQFCDVFVRQRTSEYCVPSKSACLHSALELAAERTITHDDKTEIAVSHREPLQQRRQGFNVMPATETTDEPQDRAATQAPACVNLGVWSAGTE